MNGNKIVEYYNYSDLGKNNPVKNFGRVKKAVLYVMTVMSENLLNIITGIATGLSINIFTNFITADDNTQIGLLVIWCIRFLSAIIFNVCIIRLTVFCTLLRSNARDKAKSHHSAIGADREYFYRKELLQSFERDYKSIIVVIAFCILSIILLLFSNILYPIIIFIHNCCRKIDVPILVESLPTT